jgi:hypothetical protein
LISEKRVSRKGYQGQNFSLLSSSKTGFESHRQQDDDDDDDDG